MTKGIRLSRERTRALARRAAEELLRTRPDLPEQTVYRMGRWANVPVSTKVLWWAQRGRLSLLLAGSYAAAVARHRPYRELERLTGAFNRWWKLWAKAFPGEPLIELQAHHAVEDRFMEFFLAKANEAFRARFADDVAKLGWKTPRDMDAVALEKALHINKAETLVKDIEVKTGMKMAGGARIDAKSLTRLLLEAIPDFRKYKNMDELLNAYEDFYRRSHEFELPDGSTQGVEPLWPRFESAFADMRRRLRANKP